MEGYYDYHARVTLHRHLTLVGLVTEDTRRIGHHVASLAGLPLIDVERLVEHVAGMSIWKIIATDGPAYYRRLEQESLEQALADRPFGVVVLGDGTLLHQANHQAVVKETTLVAIERDLANCYWRFQSLRKKSPDLPFWHPLFPSELTSIDQVRPFYQERQPALKEADHTLPFAGHTASDIANQLLDLLEVDV